MFIIVDQINGELFTGFYSGSLLFWSTYEVDHYVSNVTTWIYKKTSPAHNPTQLG